MEAHKNDGTSIVREFKTKGKKYNMNPMHFSPSFSSQYQLQAHLGSSHLYEALLHDQ